MKSKYIMVLDEAQKITLMINEEDYPFISIMKTDRKLPIALAEWALIACLEVVPVDRLHAEQQAHGCHDTKHPQKYNTSVFWKIYACKPLWLHNSKGHDIQVFY